MTTKRDMKVDKALKKNDKVRLLGDTDVRPMVGTIVREPSGETFPRNLFVVEWPSKIWERIHPDELRKVSR